MIVLQLREKRRRLLFLAAGLMLCILGGWLVRELVISYYVAMGIAKSRNASVAKLSAQRLTGALREIDYIMRDVHDRIDNDLLKFAEGAGGRPTQKFNKILLRKIDSHPWLFMIGVMNDRGVFVANVNKTGPMDVGRDFSFREYFAYPAAHPKVDHFCSKAFVETMTGNVWFACSRTVRLDGGKRFGGVVVAGLDGQYLRGLFGITGFAEGGAVAIVDAAGKPLFLDPYIPDIDNRKTDIPGLREFMAGTDEAVQRVTLDPIDNGDRLFAFQKVEDFPYTVVVSTPVHVDLRQWSLHCYASVAGFVLIAGLLLGLASLAGRLQKANERLSDQAGELERQAHTDPLTGIGNRRHFFELAEHELMRSRRHEKPLSLLMLDIDHFKGVNDTYGHDAGDAVLKALCTTCNGIVRKIDIFARFGGEEFVVMLAETGCEQAEQVAERLRERLADTAVALPDGRTVCFSVSIGVATLCVPEDTLADLIKRADVALYEAKNTGRNRVCVLDG